MGLSPFSAQTHRANRDRNAEDVGADRLGFALPAVVYREVPLVVLQEVPADVFSLVYSLASAVASFALSRPGRRPQPQPESDAVPRVVREVAPEVGPAVVRVVVRLVARIEVGAVVGFVVSSVGSADATPQAARGPWSGRQDCGQERPYHYIWTRRRTPSHHLGQVCRHLVHRQGPTCVSDPVQQDPRLLGQLNLIHVTLLCSALQVDLTM